MPSLLVGSPLVWNITNSSTVDFDFLVIGDQEPRWERQLPGRIVEDPCSGARTLILRTDGSTPKRRGSVQVEIGPSVDQPNRDVRLAAFLAAWVNGGPYTLTMPTGRTMTMVFDPEIRWIEQRLYNNNYAITVGIVEQ